MSLQHVIAAGKVDVPFSTRRVLLALADMANSEGRCAPTLRGLVEATNINELRVYDALDSLLKRRLILGIRDRWVAGANEENNWITYRLNLDGQA